MRSLFFQRAENTIFPPRIHTTWELPFRDYVYIVVRKIPTCLNFIALFLPTDHNSSISSSPTVNAELHSYKQLKKGMFWSSATQPLE